MQNNIPSELQTSKQMFTLFVYGYPQFPISRCFLAQGRLEHSVHEWCVGDERLMSLHVQVPASIYQGVLIILEM